MALPDLEVLAKTITYLQTLRKTEELTQLVARQTQQLAMKEQALEQAQQFKTLYEELVDQHATVLKTCSELQQRTADLTAENELLKGELAELQKANTYRLDKMRLEALNKATAEQERKTFLERSKGHLYSLFTQAGWQAVRSFLTSPDVVCLLVSSKWLLQRLCSDQATWRYLCFDMAKQSSRLSVVFKMQSDLTMLSAEQDMKLIIEKYLVQGYRVGTPLETTLMDICKTLLALHRSLMQDLNSQPQDKYLSISELIRTKFPMEHTVELLHRIGAALSRAPTKMNEWILFLENSFAAMLFDGAELLDESRDLEKIKDFLHEEAHRVKEDMKRMNEEKFDLERALQAEKELKEYLSRRTQTLEATHSAAAGEITGLKSLLEMARQQKTDAEVALIRYKEEQELKAARLSQELSSTRDFSDKCKRQKQHLDDLLEKFRQFFESLGLTS